MQLLIRLFCFVSVLLLPVVAEPAAIAVNASCAKAHIDDGTTGTCTFSALPVAGDTVIVSMAYGEYNGVTPSCATASGGTVIDSQGNSFTMAVESPLIDNDRAVIWYRRLALSASGTYTVTVTCPSASWVSFAAHAVAGLLSASVLDQTGFASTRDVQLAVQTTNPIGQGNQLFVAVLSHDLSGTVTTTPSGGWTEQWEQENCSAHQCGSAVTQISAIAGQTPSHQWDLSPIAEASAAIATFRGEDAAGGTINRSLTWTDRSNNEDRFRVQKRTDVTAPSWVDVVTNLPPNTQQYAAVILTTETNDCWRVWADNVAGSNVSNEFCPSGAPPPPPPPPPPPGGMTLSGLMLDLDDELL